ncbi:MAG: hypothetical protein GX260_03555 [Tissierellia bacterium]|nr:hypothetical protein [Bacillota bacterium]NLL22838.1 hypothetical protein [Tissierellia bacterium]
MINVQSEQYQNLNQRYRAVTGYIIPLEMISDSETMENLERYVSMCEKEGRDVFPDIYKWDYSLDY